VRMCQATAAVLGQAQLFQDGASLLLQVPWGTPAGQLVKNLKNFTSFTTPAFCCTTPTPPTWAQGVQHHWGAMAMHLQDTDQCH
jgi:hypothetical protein